MDNGGVWVGVRTRADVGGRLRVVVVHDGGDQRQAQEQVAYNRHGMEGNMSSGLKANGSKEVRT